MLGNSMHLGCVTAALAISLACTPRDLDGEPDVPANVTVEVAGPSPRSLIRAFDDVEDRKQACPSQCSTARKLEHEFECCQTPLKRKQAAGLV